MLKSKTLSAAAAKAIDGYQVMVDGKETQVKDLTEEQAKLQLCLAIDFMERMDSFSADIASTMDAWRRGQPTPTDTTKGGAS